MPDRALQEALDRLRAEVREIESNDRAAEQRLQALINEVEARLAHPEDADLHRNLVSAIRAGIEHFEETHPRATAILNEITMALSNMGI
jgi:hypothetical protein